MIYMLIKFPGQDELAAITSACWSDADKLPADE